nr:TonB-dependent receptor [uncultured Bacteroides sp.]
MAQRNEIIGKVTDSKGEALIGVSISLKDDKNRGTVTDLNGTFTLNVENNKTLVFTYIGYVTQEVLLKGLSHLNVVLNEDTQKLDEVVVVGYGTQKKSDITGSVAVVNAKDLQKYATSDIAQLLQGRTAGVQVNSDGQPGATPSIRIRGYSTFGDAQPLYVIDGVPVGTSSRDFNPNDIESMQVLKDASAGAIYGSRAANGVIIITTKSGKNNTPLKVNYNGYYGVDQVWQKIPVLGREDYQTIVNEVRTNAGLSKLPGNDPSSPYYISDVDTDWQKEGLKLGMRQNHNINLSGGGQFTTYNVGLDYTQNKGTFEGNGPTYERYSARMNSTAEKGIFKFGESFYYAHSHENTLTYNSTILKGSRPPLIIDLVEAVPTQKIYDANNLGGYGGTEAEIHNVISLNAIGINRMFKNYTDVDRIVASGYGELTLLKKKNQSLKYKINLSYDKTIAHDYSFIPAFDLGYFFTNSNAQLTEGNRTYTTALVENTLNYKMNLGKHSLDVLVGQMYQSVDFYDASGHTESLTEPYYPVLNNGSNKSASGSKSKSVLSSYLGRLNYNYDDKYLITATLRRDGSSRFAPSNRFGYFPSIALAWRLSNEESIKLPEFISDVKIRGSYGQLGNQNIGDYLYSSYINSNMPYNFNGTKVTGGLQTSVVSESIKWEVKTTTNIGVDMNMFNGAIDFSAEYYNSKTKDLLVGVPIPFTVGSVNFSPTVNAGSMRNSGFEFAATYHKTKGELRFDISANVSTLKNKVLALGGNNEPIYGTGSKTEVGSEVGQHFGYEATGIFQSTAEVSGHAFQSAATAPGDIIFKDQLTVDTNGDGVADAGDGIINADDRIYLGSAIPKLNYGFNISLYYKKWDLSLFASGASGYKINSRMYRDLMLTTDYINRHEDILDRWTPTNTNTNIPRVVSDDPNGNQRDSNRKGWLQNGDYLRINTLSLGYTFPNNFIKGLNTTRIYVTAQNLYTFQAYKGYNPDFTSGVWNPGFDAGSFPKPRTIMLGMQLSL